MLLFADIPASCLIGVQQAWTTAGLIPVAVYDREAIIDHFVSQGMDPEGADEYIDFNMVGGYVAPDQPVIVTRMDPEMVVEMSSTDDAIEHEH